MLCNLLHEAYAVALALFEVGFQSIDLPCTRGAAIIEQDACAAQIKHAGYCDHRHDAALRAAQSLGCSHLRDAVVLVSAHVLTRRQRRLKQT